MPICACDERSLSATSLTLLARDLDRLTDGWEAASGRARRGGGGVRGSREKRVPCSIASDAVAGLRGAISLGSLAGFSDIGAGTGATDAGESNCSGFESAGNGNRSMLVGDTCKPCSLATRTGCLHDKVGIGTTILGSLVAAGIIGCGEIGFPMDVSRRDNGDSGIRISGSGLSRACDVLALGGIPSSSSL